MNRNILASALVGMLSFAVPSPVRGQQDPPAAPAPASVHFLIRLEEPLSTKDHDAGKKFKAKTIDPLATADGYTIEPGAEIRGHISKIEPAKVTGHARMWLTFDDIRSKAGKFYVVAEVVDVPGDHSVRADEQHEGEISTKTSKGRHEAEAAAGGAVIGATAGAKVHGGKGAAIGAASGAVAGFLIASGFGQELVLQKDTKLELELERPLYLANR